MTSNSNTVETRESQTAISPLPVQKMHKIVLGMVGLLFLVAATYPLSMYRVTVQGEGWGDKQKVKGIYVKSLDEAKKTTEQPLVAGSTKKPTTK
jgi:hypothetical protein